MTDWTTLRAHFAAQLAASGLTQAEVARRGGLSGQNAISKLLANTRRGPSIETWLRALAGLGLTLEDVVASLEVPLPGSLSIRERLHALELARRDELAAIHRRLHDPTPVSPTDLDARIAAVVHAALDPLRDRLTDRLGADLDDRRAADSDAADGRARDRRDVRKHA